MRARNIKPGFFRNEHLADLPHAARILFIGLWCLADRRGMVEHRPRKIAAEIFPYEPEVAITVNSLLDNLESAGFVRRVTDGLNEYVHIVHFLRHQTPHKTERESGLPHPEKCTPLSKRADNGEPTVNPRMTNDGNRPDSLIHRFTDSPIPDSPIPDSKSSLGDGADAPSPAPLSRPAPPDGAVREMPAAAVDLGGPAAAPPVAPEPRAQEYQPGFIRFWLAYPVKRDKKEAYKIWRHDKLERMADVIEAAVHRQIRERAQAPKNAFMPEWKHPSTWLRHGCWDDEPVTAAPVRRRDDDLYDPIISSAERAARGGAA